MPLSGCAVPPLLSTAQGTVLEQEEFRSPHSRDGFNEAPESNSVPSTTHERDKPGASASLTAYAQLATYRFGCSHSFVVLFERGQGNIITEASPSLLLDGNGGADVDDEVHQQVKVLSLRLVEAHVADTSSVVGNSTRCVMRDLSRDNHSDNHLIQFFAAVPIHGVNKDIVGAVCVVDKMPHPNFGNSEVAGLQEIADLVAGAIKDSSAGEHHLQAERLIDGLTTFVSGQVVPGLGDYHSRRPSYLPGIDDLLISENCSASSPQYAHSQTPGTPPSQFFSRIHGRKNSVTVIEGSTVSHSMSLLFSRASALLQKCMDLDGVLFLDATRSNARRFVSPDTARHQPNVSSSCSASLSDLEMLSKDGGSGINSPGLSSVGPWRERVCEPLGCALSESANRCTSPQFSISEGLLHDLFAAHPKGTIFNSRTLTDCTSQKCGHGTDAKGSRDHAIILRLVQDLPEARSLLFLPMWNWNTSRWLAGALLWTSDSQRHFEQTDLFYVKAYGDSIVSEAAQMDWQATEKSKSDLLSSVSHELRSPLHGMLASVELLHTTDLQPTQQDTLTMIETCGLTLLDTLNYLLDFTKINNLTSADAKNDGDGQTTLADLTCEFDLDVLVEDVVDTLYAAHRSLINASQVAGRYLPSGPSVGIGSSTGTESAKESKDLSVIVRVEPGDWRLRSIPGGWRRIVMNLLGNAFKFTKSGFIEVTLARKMETFGAKREYAHLTITDTGCGISPEYLEHKLFQPFTQENFLTEGVGLGLSIVDQIVTNVGGQIDVKSTVGIGSRFDAYIPVESIDAVVDGASGSEQPESGSASRVSLVGLNVFSNMQRSSRRLSVDAKRRLSVRSALSNAILGQPGWSVSFADTLSQASGDIGIVEESSLAEMAEQDPITTELKALVILGQHGVSLPIDPVMKEVDVLYVPQPLTPRKIIGALHAISSLPEGSGHIDSADGIPAGGRSLSEAFALAQQTESPPVVEGSVDEFRASTPKASKALDVHVLIVDDNDINLKILATFMRRIGCSYETANNGLVALEKYRQSERQFDYILMDISMPVMDGISSTSKIREYEEENSLPRAAIMALTGVASATMQQQAFAAGVDDYLVKPLSLRDLKRVMNIA